jgi:hypothetical protein
MTAETFFGLESEWVFDILFLPIIGIINALLGNQK